MIFTSDQGLGEDEEEEEYEDGYGDGDELFPARWDVGEGAEGEGVEVEGEDEGGDEGDTSTTESQEPTYTPESNIIDIGEGIDAKLLAMVNSALELETEDLFGEIVANFDVGGVPGGDYRVNSVLLSKPDPKSYLIDDLNPELQKHLAWIKAFLNSTDRMVDRNQKWGRIDQRRLHRAGVDGNCFKRYHTAPQVKAENPDVG